MRLDRPAEHLVDALGRAADHGRRRAGRTLAGQPRRAVVGQKAALQQTGVLATAQIQGLAETGVRINERPVVNLDLHITGPGFDFNDQKRVTVDISKQAIVTARKLVVLVDPNTREYEIDWQASALVAGVVPAQITDQRGQQDLRPERSGRPADGDPADLQSQQPAVRRHGRHPQLPGGAPAGAGGGPAAAAEAHRSRRRPAGSPRRRSNRWPNGSRNWRSCTSRRVLGRRDTPAGRQKIIADL